MSTIQSQKHEFKAEVKQLLNILVHSLYTNREIFLRELISNASDAMDKLRFESNKGSGIADSGKELEINIEVDDKNNKLIISDAGIGMTEEELIKNIGTIAKSGTSEFLEKLKESKQKAENIIGKFGVGFYSVFMVADKVELTTKSFISGAEPVKWISDGLGDYEIQPVKDNATRGTKIEIFLKEETKEFASKDRIKNIIKKHSSFISFPIKVEGEVVNTQPALWREPKSNIKKEQYSEFYKFLTYDSEEPLETMHFSVDMPIQFSSILFIPPHSTEFIFMDRENYGLDLYVRRVLIQHQNKDILPEYLSFVKGVVDSEDIPLNISRETLQENVVFNKISTSITSQVLSALIKMAKNDKDKYKTFWQEHGKIFKLGYGDFQNHEKFSKLLRFNSSGTEKADDLVSFEEYVERMKKDQKDIYYISGNSRDAIEMDPHLEIFKSKGIEVLYLIDPADEFVMNSLRKFNDFDLISVDQADLKKLDEMEDVDSGKKDEKKEELSKEDELHMSSLYSRIKEILGDRVKEVKVSDRLKDSPAVLVNADGGLSSSMHKMMQMMNKDTSIPPKIMEINKDHNLIRNLLKVYKNDSKDEYITTVVEQLFEGALLLEGYLADPHKLVQRINKTLDQSSGWYTSVKNLK